jgi:hypothetical protein
MLDGKGYQSTKGSRKRESTEEVCIADLDLMTAMSTLTQYSKVGTRTYIVTRIPHGQVEADTGRKARFCHAKEDSGRE